jgi:hypothetical protein
MENRPIGARESLRRCQFQAHADGVFGPSLTVTLSNLARTKCNQENIGSGKSGQQQKNQNLVIALSFRTAASIVAPLRPGSYSLHFTIGQGACSCCRPRV